MLKLTFLGTSHGYPTVDRFCFCLLIETEQGAYIFDAGAPVRDLLVRMGFDMSRVKGVFITHQHSDHLAGLYPLVEGAGWFYKTMDFDVYLPEASGIALFDQWAVTGGCPRHKCVRLYTFEEGVVFDNGDVKVTAVRTGHSAVSYGFLVEDGEHRVYITGDLKSTRGEQLEDFPTELLLERTDAVIAECAHFPASALLGALRGINAERMFITHVFPTEKYATFEAANAAFGGRLLMPRDGDSYTIA